MTELQDMLLHGKRLIRGGFLHAGLMWASLALSYNSYKEYMRVTFNSNIFPIELKAAIKSVFPWATLIFTTLYLLYGVWTYKKDNYPTFKQYCILIVLYLLFVNFIFFSKGMGVLVVLNLSSIYLVLLLFVGGGIYRIFPQKVNIVEILTGKSSLLPIMGFTILLIICSFLLIFEQEKVAENLANIAYFLLAIWLGIEVYCLIKCREKSVE